MSSFESGLSHVAGGSYAWLQADGGWGLSNAGLVLAGGESVLIDTLFDLAHTRRMLEGLGPVTAGAPITLAVNTHGNGDHWFGNELLDEQVSIIAAENTVRDMQAVGPQAVAGLLQIPGQIGRFGNRVFGDFQFDGIHPRYPDRTYTREHVLKVDGVELLLIDVGPAHTSADTIVYCERDAVVFTGDIVFAGGTPVMWEGPVDNWVRACARIKELGARRLVPGHGPVSPVSRLQDMTDYLEFVRESAVPRFEAGMPVEEAARDIDLGLFADWPEAERLAANLATIYRELGPQQTPPPPGPAMFGCMATLHDHWATLDDGRGGDETL